MQRVLRLDEVQEWVLVWMRSRSGDGVLEVTDVGRCGVGALSVLGLDELRDWCPCGKLR